MGVKIVATYREELPAMRLIGRRYTDADRDQFGGFGSKWGEWFQTGLFDRLEACGPLQTVESGFIGFMCAGDGAAFEYWIGLFFPEETPVLDGFQSLDLPAGGVGTCFIQGMEGNGEIYGAQAHDLCIKKLAENGMSARDDCRGPGQKYRYFFERYHCPRFTRPQRDGTVILDYCGYIN